MPKIDPLASGEGSKVDTIYNKNNKRENPLPDTPSFPCDAAKADIAAPALDFSSLLASVATLSDEQKQQLREALLGQAPAPATQEPVPASPPAVSPQPARDPAGSGEKEQKEQDERSCTPPSETRSKPPKDTSLAERIEAVFLCLDKLAQQTTGDPDFTWTRSERAKRSVKQLLADGRVVTPEKLSAVYLHMATMKPDPKTGFTWANKLSVANVCNNYDSIWLEIVKAKQLLKDAASPPGAATGGPSLRTLVVFGNTDHGIPSQPLPVTPLRRDFSPRRLAGKGV